MVRLCIGTARRKSLITLEKKTVQVRCCSSKVIFSDVTESHETKSYVGNDENRTFRSKEQKTSVRTNSKNWKNKNNDKDSEVLPMFGAMFIASCLGGPVCVLAGIKLGLFAAVGGGMVGYTTGKMFAESGLEIFKIVIL